MIKYFKVRVKVSTSPNTHPMVTGLVLQAAFLSNHTGQSASMRNARKYLRHRQFKIGGYISGHSARVEYRHS